MKTLRVKNILSDFKNKKSEYYEVDNYVVYILLFPSEKIFYINKSLKSSIKETYRHNIKCRRNSSCEFIKQNKFYRPCLFILEDLKEITSYETDNYVFVWTKIIIENGYKCYNGNGLIKLSEQLNYQNKRLYNKRKDTKLDEIFSCENCLIPSYKNALCEKQFYNNQ